MFELIIIALCFVLGFLLQSYVSIYKVKIFLFSFLPIVSFLMLMPLNNGSTVFIILKKFIVYQRRKKKYKL